MAEGHLLKNHARPRRQEQGSITVHTSEPAGVIEKRWPKTNFYKTIQGQDDESKNPLQYTKQYQQVLLKKGGRRPPFTEDHARPRRQKQEASKYTKQSQHGLLKKDGRRPPFTKQCKAKTMRARTHYSTQSRTTSSDC